MAEDILQEVFLKLMAANLRLDDHEMVVKWLFVVSRNTTLDMINKNKRLVYTDQLFLHDAAVDLLEYDEASYSEQLALLNLSINQLSRQKAHVIKKYKLENKNIHTVAEELNITVHTAKYYYKQAIQQLRHSVQMNKKMN